LPAAVQLLAAAHCPDTALCYRPRVQTAIHWFRRDLRVSDNTALSAAAAAAQAVVPAFIFDDAILTAPDVGAARVSFLLRSLESLAKNLEALGYRLIIRRGKPQEELVKLARETGAEAVFWNKDYEPYARERDARVAVALQAAGVAARPHKDVVLWEEQEILTQAGRPFTVFTPYSRAWRARGLHGPQPRLRAAETKPPAPASVRLPADSAELGHPLTQTVPPAGEHAALEALRGFLKRNVFHYGEERNFPALDHTSHLSPHLRFGTINIRTIVAKLNAATAKELPAAARRSADVFLSELIWREFYIQVLANFPHVTRGCFRPEYDALAWRENREHFEAWRKGLTGYPIVDAAMRCLNATGWMHNRLRMIVAMFLTKDLLLPWQWGERYFMQQLVDGDLAANNGGWQWSAGTGTDAAPYFRIFNPVSQGAKFDPEGEFVRRWVPELAGLTSATIHEPWREPLLAGAAADYPERIVHHEEQRLRCLAMFKAVKDDLPSA
jgi:deoxyribodipyrimidine photo-lyase